MQKKNFLFLKTLFISLLSLLINHIISETIFAQTINNLPPLRDLVPPPTQPPPLPDKPLQTPDKEILPTPPPSVNPIIPETSETITVTKFEFIGNTIFSDSQLESKVANNLRYKSIPLSTLLRIANDVAKMYAEAGYTTSGAVISIPQTTQQEGRGVVIIEVIEGKLTEINVTPLNESERLNPDYIRSRIAVRVGKPLNLVKLQEALQLLLLDPLITNISAELSDGTETGTSILNVQYASGDSFKLQGILDNNRAPSVGTFRRGVGIEEGNLFGWGDTIRAEYLNTDGSDEFHGFYSIPVNPYNGNIKFRFRTITSKVISDEFERFDLKSDYQQYELTLRQPVYQTPNRDVALGITFDRQLSNSSIGDRKFPLSPGANLEGETRISTLRIFKEWLERNPRNVFAARSSFDIGINALGVTNAFDAEVNPDAPSSNYFLWRGQLQYVQVFAPDMLILARTNIQLTDRTLLPSERFVIGGFGTVRGYPQNYRLTDNGIIATIEGRIPVFRQPRQEILLQLTPFVDFGSGWNDSIPETQPNTLASVGLGLSFQYRDVFDIRFDYGIPLTEVDTQGDSLQENGLTFSVIFTPF